MVEYNGNKKETSSLMDVYGSSGTILEGFNTGASGNDGHTHTIPPVEVGHTHTTTTDNTNTAGHKHETKMMDCYPVDADGNKLLDMREKGLGGKSGKSKKQSEIVTIIFIVLQMIFFVAVLYFIFNYVQSSLISVKSSSSSSTSSKG